MKRWFIIKKAFDTQKPLQEAIRRCDDTRDFGNDGSLSFPCGKIFDDITLSLIPIAEEILGANVILRQSVVWKKTPGWGDQRMHMDFPNHTCGIPPCNYAVAFMIYYNTAGGTAVVDDEDLYDLDFVMSSLPGVKSPYINDKESALNLMPHTQILYDREKIVRPEAGDIFVYRLDTWHRGIPTDKTRYTHSIIYSTRDAQMMSWHRGWTYHLYDDSFKNYLSTLTEKQKDAIQMHLHPSRI